MNCMAQPHSTIVIIVVAFVLTAVTFSQCWLQDVDPDCTYSQGCRYVSCEIVGYETGLANTIGTPSDKIHASYPTSAPSVALRRFRPVAHRLIRRVTSERLTLEGCWKGVVACTAAQPCWSCRQSFTHGLWLACSSLSITPFVLQTPVYYIRAMACRGYIAEWGALQCRPAYYGPSGQLRVSTAHIHTLSNDVRWGSVAIRINLLFRKALLAIQVA